MPAVLACSLAFGQSGAPQQSPPAAQPQKPEPAPIRVQVNEVIVPVTVTDEKGRFVSNLTQKDFRVYEDGREQRIRYFNAEHNQPVVVGFLVDLSNRARVHWQKFQEAAMELVWALMPGDRRFNGFLVTFSTDAELAVKTSHDPEKIVERLRKTKPGGGSALFDAVYLACTRKDLVKGEPIEPRRVLVIMGDGTDSASSHTLDEVLELAQRNLVTIYGVSTTAFGFTSDGDRNLQRLAEETGGRVEYPLQGVYKDVSGYLSKPQDAGNYALTVGTGEYAAQVASGIFDAVAKVTGEVTTQYILRYTPENSDTNRQYRAVHIDVPGLPGVKVRARKGYYPYNP